MSRLARYRAVFEEEASEFIIAQSKRQRRRLMDACYALADNPFAAPDFQLPDADGRIVSHVSIGGFIVSYWVDHPVKRIVIAEIESVD